MAKGSLSRAGSTRVDGTISALVAGITAWVTFQARRRRRTVYSEYYLYGPLMDIADAHGWEVDCEAKVPGRSVGSGDKKRVDLVLEWRGEQPGCRFGIEVKWVRQPQKSSKNPPKTGGRKKPRPALNVSKDLEKLVGLLKRTEGGIDRAFLLIVGVEDDLVGSLRCKPAEVKGAIEKVAGGEPKNFAAWFKTNKTNWGAVAVEVYKKGV